MLVRVALYFSPPNQTRIEVKNLDNSLQTVMIGDGTEVTEFHRWDNTFMPSQWTPNMPSSVEERCAASCKIAPAGSVTVTGPVDEESLSGTVLLPHD